MYSIKELFITIIFVSIILWFICSEKSIENIYKSNQKGITTLNIIFKLNEELDLDNNLDNSDSVEKKSNIALKYYEEWKNYSNRDNWKGKDIIICDTDLPSIEEIDFNNIFWQTIPNTNKTQYFLYNAFYDNRGTDKYVRVIGSLMGADIDYLNQAIDTNQNSLMKELRYKLKLSNIFKCLN